MTSRTHGANPNRDRDSIATDRDSVVIDMTATPRLVRSESRSRVVVAVVNQNKITQSRSAWPLRGPR